jgi:hypothetical protein
MSKSHETNESSALIVTPTQDVTPNNQQIADNPDLSDGTAETTASVNEAASVDQTNQNPSSDISEAAAKSILDGFDDTDFPFRLEKALLNIWGEPEHKDRLKALIEANGWTKEPIWVASVKGVEGKPFLFDGMTRFMIWLERKAQGIVEPLPEIESKTFETMYDALGEAIKIQNGRRSTTPAQIAFASLLALKQEGYDISPKTQGRQPKVDKAKQTALKNLPSAKELATKIGVSDPIIRVVQKAMKYPELISQLVSVNPENQITTTQAQNRMEGYRRDIDVHNRQKTLAKRREKLAKMKATTTSNIIGPSGIHTGDSVEFMDRIEPCSVSFALTSIPYPCNVEYDAAKPFNGDYQAYPLSTNIQSYRMNHCR